MPFFNTQFNTLKSIFKLPEHIRQVWGAHDIFRIFRSSPSSGGDGVCLVWSVQRREIMKIAKHWSDWNLFKACCFDILDLLEIKFWPFSKYCIGEIIQTKWSKNENSKKFPLNSGIKNVRNPVTKNSRIPGFCKILSRKIPGLTFLIPLGPAQEPLISKTSQSWPRYF